MDRDEEFAPVKNAPGSLSDSPDTARSAISKLHRKWLQGCGLVVEGDSDALVEISPLVSCGENDLLQRVTKRLVAPLHITLEDVA